ncbi:MAG TPA: glycine cleavage system aminomethyltransferase GcvT [Gammaproteobacteria bacterium]|nr:glycine cleavage system aminomethyltransferase GcvT [Gammaproteobacteria bacterium]
MGKKTSLYHKHIEANAKIVDFGGYDMPLHYGSQIEEHNQVRSDAGMFDVSHMVVVDLRGEAVRGFLRYLLANNVDRLQEAGKALYSCMLNGDGGIIDDLIVYFMDENWFRLVVNAATRDRDLAWIKKQAADFDVAIDVRDDLAMIAVQGPEARTKTHAALGSGLKQKKADQLAPFYAVECDGFFIARTGYTGEDGYEIMLPVDQVESFWQALLEQGVKPVGLGARDTLRLEAGMNLYGTDMDESVTPLESGLGWTVAWEPSERHFIGRDALQAQRKKSGHKKFTGLILDGKGMLRNHQKVVVDGVSVGEVTSGSFSPTLGRAIAFARVDACVETHCNIEVRDRYLPATVVKLPFVRHGKSCLQN